MAAPIKMPFGMLSWVDLGNLVLDGGSDPPVGRSNFVGEGHAPTSPMTFCHELRKKNGWNDDRDTLWDVDMDGPKETCIRWGSDPDNTLPWAMQKWLNRSRCCLVSALGWAKRSGGNAALSNYSDHWIKEQLTDCSLSLFHHDIFH